MHINQYLSLTNLTPPSRASSIITLIMHLLHRYCMYTSSIGDPGNTMLNHSNLSLQRQVQWKPGGGGMLKCYVRTAWLVWEMGYQSWGQEEPSPRSWNVKLQAPVLRLRKNMTKKESLSRVTPTAYGNAKDEWKKVIGVFPISLCCTQGMHCVNSCPVVCWEQRKIGLKGHVYSRIYWLSFEARSKPHFSTPMT